MPALYVTSTRPAIQGFPTDDDDFSGKTHIVVTGYSLSQIKAIWPHLRAYRKQRYNGFDSSHAQHRPASIFAREKAALLSADYEGAINKAEWLSLSAQAQGTDDMGGEDSILREVRRAKAQFSNAR